MLLKLYKKFNQNITSPVKNQKEVLKNILNVLQITKENFEQLPVSKYDKLVKNNFYNKENNCTNYVRSSGTNSAAKLIPISKDYLFENHIECSKYSFYNMIIHHNIVRVLSGKNITLTGYEYDEQYKNKNVFDVSALLFNSRPSIFKFISKPTGLYISWEEKLKYFKENYDSYKDSCSISGVPTWIISLFSHLEKEFNKPIKELLPNLKYVIHGGVDFTNYFPIFSSIFSDRKLQFFEIFNCTEGYIGFQFESNKKDLLLSTNTGIYFEFKKDNKLYNSATISLDTYELIISNRDGLVRYATGDLIEITSLQPLLFIFKGRVSEFINAFGEDLTINQTNIVVKEVTQEFNLNIYEYFITPSYITTNKKGYHEWFLFVTSELPPLELQEKIAKAIDYKLKVLNNNYKQKRNKSLAVEAPKLHFFKDTKYRELLKKEAKQEGGQAKIKRLHNNRNIIDSLGV